jgi:hypothetical protein
MCGTVIIIRLRQDGMGQGQKRKQHIPVGPKREFKILYTALHL